MDSGKSGIIAHNLRVFYLVDTFRAMWFITSIWVAYEKQFLNLSQITLIEAVILTVALIMQLPTGAFADLFGKKKAMIVGCFLYASAMLIYSLSGNFNMFLGYALVFGLAEAFIDGTREALIYDTMKEGGREEDFSNTASKLSMIFQVSLSVATIVGGYIGLFSYELVIRMSGMAFLMAMITAFKFQEPHIDTEKFTLKNYVEKTKQGIKELVKNDYVRKISLFYITVGSITWICVITLNMMLLNEMNFTTGEIGITIAFARIMNSVVLFRLISKTRIFNKERTLIILPLILVFTLVPAIFFSKWMVLIPVTGAMFVSNARWNLISRYTNAEFTSKNRATAISALCMIIGIIFVIVVGSSGYLMENFGGARPIYSVLGLVSLVIAFPLGLNLARSSRK